MTRLTENNIENIPYTWEKYESRLHERTKLSLFALACSTLGIEEDRARQKCQEQNLAVIPLNQGEGCISGFSETLKSIAEHLGLNAIILEADEAGFTKYQNDDAFQMCIWADDDNYFVEHKINQCKIDNNIATGMGFAHALHCMLAKRHKNVLVRGCGPIGTNAAKHLAALGYTPLLYDINTAKAEKLNTFLKKQGISSVALDETSLKRDLHTIHALFDAAPISAQNSWLGDYEFSYITAPCVPCLWEITQTRWHDPLQLGTAVMLIAACMNKPI